MVILSYFLCNKNILSPSFISCAMYLIGTIVVYTYRIKWSVIINANTVLIIICFLLFILVGDVLASSIKKGFTQFNNNQTYYFKIGNSLMVFIIAFMICGLIYYTRSVIQLSQLGGGSGDYSQMLGYARHAKNNLGFKMSTSAIIIFWICEGLFYISTYIFINNIFNCKSKITKELKYLFPIILYTFMAILSTGRTLIMREFIFIVVIIVVFKYRHINWSAKFNKKIIKIISIVISAFFILFYYLGLLTGKSSNKEFFDYIAVYFGSSIAALNEYMKYPFRSTDFLWGGHTLFGFYTILRKVLSFIPNLSTPLEFTILGSMYATNIYTPIRRYYQDFGYIGVIIIAFFIGFYYKKFLLKIKYKPSNISTILYAYAFFPIVEIMIEERVFMDLLTIKSIFIVVFITIMYRLLVKGYLIE